MCSFCKSFSIGEGFESARKIAKIEVATAGGELLREQVHGVIAVVSDGNVRGDYIFRHDESLLIADFIEKRFLAETIKHSEKLVLLVNGRKVVLKDFVQDILAGTVTSFIQSLKSTEDAREIELQIRLDK